MGRMRKLWILFFLCLNCCAVDATKRHSSPKSSFRLVHPIQIEQTKQDPSRLKIRGGDLVQIPGKFLHSRTVAASLAPATHIIEVDGDWNFKGRSQQKSHISLHSWNRVFGGDCCCLPIPCQHHRPVLGVCAFLRIFGPAVFKEPNNPRIGRGTTHGFGISLFSNN
jgi:hypothetical protein